MKGKTQSGYEFDIDDRILSDWRFVEALTKCQNSKGDTFGGLDGVQKMTRLLLGDKFEGFMDHIASKNGGFCPSNVIMAEITEIFQSAKDSKN